MPRGLTVLEDLTPHVNNVLVVLTLNRNICHIYHGGEMSLKGREHVLDEIRACRLPCLECKPYESSVLHVKLMCAVFLLTERILNQARGASVPLYILA